MNKIATGLLVVTALSLIGFGVVLTIFWVSRPLGHFAAGEMAGTAIGVVIALVGAGVGLAARAVWRDRRGGFIAAAVCATGLIFLAYVALSTPGPAAIPVPLSVGAALIGLALAGLVLARAAGRAAP